MDTLKKTHIKALVKSDYGDEIPGAKPLHTTCINKLQRNYSKYFAPCQQLFGVAISVEICLNKLHKNFADNLCVVNKLL